MEHKLVSLLLENQPRRLLVCSPRQTRQQLLMRVLFQWMMRVPVGGCLIVVTPGVRQRDLLHQLVKSNIDVFDKEHPIPLLGGRILYCTAKDFHMAHLKVPRAWIVFQELACISPHWLKVLPGWVGLTQSGEDSHVRDLLRLSRL